MKWPFLHYFLAFFVQLRLLERLQKLRGNQLFVLFQLHFASLKQTKIEQIKDRESVCVSKTASVLKDLLREGRRRRQQNSLLSTYVKLVKTKENIDDFL